MSEGYCGQDAYNDMFICNIGTVNNSAAHCHVGTQVGGQRMPDKDNFNCVIGGDSMSEENLAVRRLTPLECERLQGYPDLWTLLPKKTEMSTEEFDMWQNIRRKWAEIEGKTYKPCKDIPAMLNWYNKMVQADSHRYKALGNSIGIPAWLHVINGISQQFEDGYVPTMASLFDGIGGFPLLWEHFNGEGSAIWAAEVEPFPIAVTVFRFPNTQKGDEQNG